MGQCCLFEVEACNAHNLIGPPFGFGSGLVPRVSMAQPAILPHCISCGFLSSYKRFDAALRNVEERVPKCILFSKVDKVCGVTDNDLCSICQVLVEEVCSVLVFPLLVSTVSGLGMGMTWACGRQAAVSFRNSLKPCPVFSKAYLWLFWPEILSE